MPSRVRSLDVGALNGGGVPQLAAGIDYPLASKGKITEQVAVITLPGSAAGLIGIRIGTEGDAIRLNVQGQVFTLTGEDRTGGVWLVWLAAIGAPASGVVEFAFGG